MSTSKRLPLVDIQAYKRIIHSTLENPRLEVQYANILNNILQTCHKIQVCRIFLQIVLPVFIAPKLRDEAMCEASLFSSQFGRAAIK